MTYYDYWDTGISSGTINYLSNNTRAAQVFKATNSYDAVSLAMFMQINSNMSAGTVYIDLYSVNGSYEPNVLLASGSVVTGYNNDVIPLGGGFVEVALSAPYTLSQNTYYAVQCRITDGTPVFFNYFNVGGTGNSFGSTHEEAMYSLNNGLTWTHLSSNDLGFRVVPATSPDTGFLSFFP